MTDLGRRYPLPTIAEMPQNATADRILGYLPRWMGNSALLYMLYSAAAAEFDPLYASLTGMLEQVLASDLAPDMDRKERDLGLPTNPALSLAERRARVYAHLRANTTATQANVFRAANSFEIAPGEPAQVEVVEDWWNYRVDIRFINLRGIPPFLPEMRALLRRMIPANLAITYTFRFLIWAELDAADITWDELDALDMTWDQFEVWDPTNRNAPPVAGISLTLTDAALAL